MTFKVAVSVLPVILIAGWLNLAASGDSLYLVTNAIWTIVTLVAAGICALLGRADGTSCATPLWITCFLSSILLAGLCALTILGIGVLIAPLAIVLLTFSLISLAADFRRRHRTR